MDEHFQPSRAAAIVSQLHKPICRSCVTGPKDWFTRRRKEFSQAFTIKKVHFMKSSVYLRIQAYKSEGKTSKKVQGQQDSQALCPTTLPWRDSLVTIAPKCRLCLKGSINLCLPTLFSHPFPWNKGISCLWNLYCCWQTQLRLVMCNSYYWEQTWQSNMTPKPWCFLCMCL